MLERLGGLLAGLGPPRDEMCKYSWSGLIADQKAAYKEVISATCCVALQEIFPPEVRKYLERLSGVEAVQKGVAQALGKKGIVLQPQQTGHAAPKVPIEGKPLQQASSTCGCVFNTFTLE